MHFPSVIQVKPTRSYKVYVYFSDGKIKLFDMKPFIGKGVFKKISKPDDFLNKCTVINHTLAWDIAGGYNEYECIDIAPDTIYIEGIDVADPLTKKVA